ncbi:hypothetical protein KAU34_08580 [candidate division WOR-3 bacterium]|nr:hypothetical protein [candidate division WOR-3 bacterium]
MKKLNLDNYSVTVKDQNDLDRIMPYNFKNTIINVLTHQQFGLNGPDMMEVAPLVKKLNKATTVVILTNEEYQEIVAALKRFKGFIKNDIEMLERIYNCPDNPDDGSNVVKLSNN